MAKDKKKGKKRYSKRYNADRSTTISKYTFKIRKLVPNIKTAVFISQNSGFLPTGATTKNKFDISPSQLIPFNTGAPLPNYNVALTNYASGFRNFLYNSVTNTGLYNHYRVLAIKVVLEVYPQALADTSNICICNTTSGTFASYNTASQSTDTRTMVAYAGKKNVIVYQRRMTDLFGIDKNQYNDIAYVSTYASLSSNLTALQVHIETLDQATLAQPMGINVRVFQLVEFADPTESVLLE